MTVQAFDEEDLSRLVGDEEHPVYGKPVDRSPKAKGDPHPYPVIDQQEKSRLSKEEPRMLLERAAHIAVYMEQGIHQKPDGSYWSGPVSRPEILRAMGWATRKQMVYSGDQKHTPPFLREPDFSRFVEYERVKRMAVTRITAQEARPLVHIIAGALSTELVRRALTEPEEISNRELLVEARHWIHMAREFETKEGTGRDVHTVINNFILAIDGLPMSARAKARELFEGEIVQMQDAARRVAALPAKSA